MPFFVTEGQSASGSSLPLLILLIPVLLLGWSMFAQGRRRKAQNLAQASLSVGAPVRTTSGIFGTVTELTDEVAGVEIAPGVVIKVDRRAVLPQSFDPVSGRTVADGTTREETGETH